MTFLMSGMKVQAKQQPAAAGLQFQSSAYGKAITLVYGTNRIAPNLIWYGDFVATPQQSSAGSAGKGGVGGGGGGKGGGGGTDYIYQTAVLLGICEGPIRGLGAVYVNKNVTTAGALGFSVFVGSYPQAPLGYLTTNHPSEALGYNGIAYAGASTYSLGNSPQLPNHNFEVMGVYSNSIPGKFDADASLVVTDLLTNAKYGVGFPIARLGDLSDYQDYTIASGLWISPAYTQQAQASSILDEIALNTNSEFVWSSGVLTIVPYGDQNITGNGHSYTAPSAPLYDLTDDDYIAAEGQDPVRLTRKRPADAFNSIKIEYRDRNNSYNPAIAEAKDQAAIDLYGLRQDTSRQAHVFADPAAAQLSVQLQLQRQAVRNTYEFTLDHRYVLLDPMDIVTLTDSLLGLEQQWVRIKEISENDDGTLTFVAEEYLAGTGSSPLYSFQQGSGFAADYNESPGDANRPVIFEAPVQIAATGLEVWMAASGGQNWGGCDVWISTDGDTYKYIGRVNGSSRQGVLTASLPSGSDPDTTNTLAVDLSESKGELLSGTQNDADSLTTLCYVDGELVSYKTATLTAAYEYDLTYLRRGAYGTSIGSHADGSQFARLDDGIFKFTYDKDRIGTTIYIKLLSFNIYGGGLQSIADVAPYTHTIQGPPAPPNVTGFTAQQKGNVVVFTWKPVSDFALKGYDIAFGPQGGTPWEDMIPLTEAARGTEMTNAAVPPGSWTFAIRARDIVDQLSPAMTTVDLTVTNEEELISSISQQPDWLGDVDGFYRHWTGVLVPMGTKDSDEYVRITPQTGLLLFQSAGGSLPTRQYYYTYTWVTATGETTPYPTSSTTWPAGVLAQVSPHHSLAPASAIGWNIYFGTSPGNLKKQNDQPIPIGTSSDPRWTESGTGITSTGSAPPTVNTTGWEVFGVYVPDPVAQATYTSPSIDTGYDDTLRVWASMTAVMGPGQSGQANLDLMLDTWLTGDPDPDEFDLWTIGSVTMRYMRARLVDTITPGQVAYITDFTPVADKSPEIQSLDNVVVAPGGTVITFNPRYHAPPFVQATPVASTPRYATADSITDTQATLHVWDETGTDVGGIVNVTITGE